MNGCKIMKNEANIKYLKEKERISNNEETLLGFEFCNTF